MNSIFCSLPDAVPAVNFVVFVWNPSPSVQFHYSTIFSTVKPRVLKSDEPFVNTYCGNFEDLPFDQMREYNEEKQRKACGMEREYGRIK